MSDTSSSDPKKGPPITASEAEAMIRGEVTLGAFLGLKNEDLYRFAETGHQLLQAGSTQQALKIFEGLVAASPHDSVFHTQLAATYMTLERFDEAFDAYDQALKFNSSNVDALVGRGEVFLRRGKVPEALADLGKAIQLDPQLQRRSTQRARATLMALKQKVDQAQTGGAAAKPPAKQ